MKIDDYPGGKPLRGRFTKPKGANQIYRDNSGNLLKIIPGDFVFEEEIERFNIDPKYFIHPDSLLHQGAFEFAYEKKGNFSVAIIRDMNGRGDILMASVIAKALKYQYGKQVKVWFCVKPGYEKILEHNPFIDKVYTSRKTVDHLVPDIKINVNDMEFKVEVKVFEKCGEVLKNRASIYLENMGLFLENKTPVYKVTEEEKNWAKKELKSLGISSASPVVGLQYFGSNITRTYPHMDRVKTGLQELGYQTVALDHKEKDGSYRWDVIETAAIINELDCIVSPNSYFYHLAGALKKRAVGVFGSCDGEIWVQDYEKVTAVQFDTCPVYGKRKCWWKLSCLPGGSLREKESVNTPQCLSNIPPQYIVNEVSKHLTVPKKILIVVLTYELLHLTKQMIDSIRSFHNYDIVVLDNASTDGTVAWCEAQGIPYIVERQTVDSAWNMGLHIGLSEGYDYTLLCNNDCILSAGYIDTLVEVAERRKAWAITGNVVNKKEGSEINFTTLTRNIEIDQNIMVPGDYSALLLSKECIEKLGGFKFFAPRYQCDEDHLLRLRLANHPLIKVYATTFFHKHGAVVKRNAGFTEERRQREWAAGVAAFKREWNLDLYGDGRKDLNSLQLVKSKNPDWEEKLYRPLCIKGVYSK